MTGKIFLFRISVLLLTTFIGLAVLDTPHSVLAQTKQPAPAEASDVRGTWSGTFYSKHKNVAAFTVTIVIDQDDKGKLVGSSSLDADCLKGVQLEVTVTGSRVVLAGSDNDGNNITVRGAIDSTGTLAKVTYILNGSATGRCETDDGTGNLARR